AARRLVGLGRSARTATKVRVRQPLRRALILHPGITLGDDVRREIADELNVKSLEDVESLAGLMSWTVVPNFRTLGPRLGPKVDVTIAPVVRAKAALERHRAWIAEEVLASSVTVGNADRALEVDGEPIAVTLARG